MSNIANSSPGDTQYINTVDYKDMTGKLKDLDSVMGDLKSSLERERRLRYSDINIEAQKAAGKLAPDELYIPQHIIDSNIRREQSSYVQYVVQSPRAVILSSIDSPGMDVQLLEQDVTQRIRFDGWQLPMFANIDGMQQGGYGVMELRQDTTKAGELVYEYVQKGDFGFVSDTKDIQEAEVIGRNYYFTKTTLINKCILPVEQGGYGFAPEQVEKIVKSAPRVNETDTAVNDSTDRSLYCLTKNTFRIGGTVVVAWSCYDVADDWVRSPQPLYLGTRELGTTQGQVAVDPMTGVPVSKESPEKEYPYFIFPYLISENDMISQLKGRVYLDQDSQEAASSLLSSFVTGHRRASNLYFAKDTDDPNADVLMQKNVFLLPGVLINSKVKQFQLQAPGADTLSAINLIVTSNQAQTSQVNFAAMNRQDSRKTATEVNAAQQESQSLSTVQVVLFSNSLRNLYSKMFSIIQSRVLAGLIQTPQNVTALYNGRYLVKPSGDVDVIERANLLAAMEKAWPVMAQTPAASAFLSDMLVKSFPNEAPKYLQIFQQAQQQAAQQQASGQAQVMQGLVQLANSPQMFSPEGQQKALPALQQLAKTISGGQQQQPQQTATR